MTISKEKENIVIEPTLNSVDQLTPLGFNSDNYFFPALESQSTENNATLSALKIFTLTEQENTTNTIEIEDSNTSLPANNIIVWTRDQPSTLPTINSIYQDITRAEKKRIDEEQLRKEEISLFFEPFIIQNAPDNTAIDLTNISSSNING